MSRDVYLGGDVSRSDESLDEVWAFVGTLLENRLVNVRILLGRRIEGSMMPLNVCFGPVTLLMEECMCVSGFEINLSAEGVGISGHFECCRRGMCIECLNT